MGDKAIHRKRLIREMVRLCQLTKISDTTYCDRYGNAVTTVTKRIPVTEIKDIDGFIVECSAVRLHNGDIEFHEYQSKGEFSNTDYTEFTTNSINTIIDVLRTL